MTRSLRSVKTQYFLAYAPLGSLGPLLPIFLEHGKGFDKSQFGMLIAMTALAMVVTPVLLALLADTKIDTRRLLVGAYTVGGSALVGIFFAEGVWMVALLYGVYAFAFAPTLPLTDALYFSLERKAAREGGRVSPYQFIRIWGTIGFIVPSLVLYVVLRGKTDAGAIMLVGAACCVLAALNAFALPDPRGFADRRKKRAALPTADALKALYGSGTWVLCAAMFLAFMAAITYYNLFPHYLKDIAGVAEAQVGLVMNIGVVVEIFCMLGFGMLRERFRLKGVLIIGLAAMALRMTLLAAFPSVWTALGVQVLHGLEALALYVVPVMYIDRLATDEFRSSIQGAYVMTVWASSRACGALLAGTLGEQSVILALAVGAVLSCAALAILITMFRPVPVRD